MVGIAINLFVIFSMLLCARHAAPPSVLGPWASKVFHLYPGQCEPALIGALIGDLFPFIKKSFAFIEKFLFIIEKFLSIVKTEKKTKDKRKWKPAADQKLTTSVSSVHDDSTLLNAQMAQVRELPCPWPVASLLLRMSRPDID